MGNVIDMDLGIIQGYESVLANVISIIVSGLVSCVVSWHYYTKTNRDMALRILRPCVVGYANEKLCPERYYEDFIGLQNHVELMYLRKSDRYAIDDMVNSLRKIREYSRNNVQANALVDFFIRYFDDQGNNLRIIPIKTLDGEIIGYEYVPQVSELYFDLLKCTENSEIYL